GGAFDGNGVRGVQVGELHLVLAGGQSEAEILGGAGNGDEDERHHGSRVVGRASTKATVNIDLAAVGCGDSAAAGVLHLDLALELGGEMQVVGDVVGGGQALVGKRRGLGVDGQGGGKGGGWLS